MKIIQSALYMDMIRLGKKESKEPNIKTLKKNRKQLSESEKKEVINRGAVWDCEPNQKPIPGVWKSIVDGDVWYVCNTHRAHQCKKTLNEAIKAFDFIKTSQKTTPLSGWINEWCMNEVHTV